MLYCQLRYYSKEMMSWKFRGQLPLLEVTSLSTSTPEVGGLQQAWRNMFKSDTSIAQHAQKMELTLWTTSRLWIFQTNSSKECKLWQNFIQDILAETWKCHDHTTYNKSCEVDNDISMGGAREDDSDGDVEEE